MNLFRFFVVLMIAAFVNCSWADSKYSFMSSNLQDKAPRTVLVVSKVLNKRIWIMGVKTSDLDRLVGDASVEVSDSNSGVTVFLAGDAFFKLAGVKIKVKGEDVLINGTAMGKDINAVVDSRGNIIMGAFIRNFDLNPLKRETSP